MYFSIIGFGYCCLAIGVGAALSLLSYGKTTACMVLVMFSILGVSGYALISDNELTEINTIDQATIDFDSKHVDIDLYFEDSTYKKTVDTMLEKERVYNSSLQLIDFVEK